MITVTDSAKEKIKDLLLEENNTNLKLRMFVQGGGCSGFSYGFTFDELENEDDFKFDIGSTFVIVDAISMHYIEGASLDYTEDLYGSEFKITNPQAVSTCGCGSSFSPF